MAKLVRTLILRTYSLSLICVTVLAALSCRGGNSGLEPAPTVGAMRIWRSSEGLPSDSVTAVLQTDDGFLWVGTSAGLARFDGVKFTPLALESLNGNNLVSVSALCQDAHGALWIGSTGDGLFEFKNGQMLHFTSSKGLLDEAVNSLAADKAGNVWIGTRSGLNLWTGQAMKSFTTQNGLPDKFVAGVNVARSGTVWITTKAGMGTFTGGHVTPYALQTESQGRSPEYLGAYEDRRGNLWAFGDTYLINLAEGKRFNYFRSSESASVRIWSLCEGRDGRLWIGTSGRGLFCFEDNHFQPVILGENRWSYDVRAICEDRDGDLWLGTSGGGLAQLRPQSMHLLRVGLGLPSSPATALAAGPSGRIYAGFLRQGLFVNQAGRFERIAEDSSLSVQNFISALAIATNGTVWAGTLGNGLFEVQDGSEAHWTTGDGLENLDVLALFQDDQNALWISSSSGALERYQGEAPQRMSLPQVVSGEAITAFSPSRLGGWWAGTQGGSLLLWRNGSFSESHTCVGLVHGPVLALDEDAQNRLWVGVDGGGLYCHTQGETWSWTTNSGLPGMVLSGVKVDEQGNLWLVTETGVYRVAKEVVDQALSDPQVPLSCRQVSEAKTFPVPGAPACGSHVVTDANGSIWFATSEGLLTVDPRQVNPMPPPLRVDLESVSVNGALPTILLGGALWSASKPESRIYHAPVGVQSVEFKFTALDFSAPETVRFRHCLVGLESQWVNDGANRSVRYGPLSHGRYQFRVEARNLGGPWEEAAGPFIFIVPTPLYLQTWALVLYLVFAVALVTGIVRIVSHRRLKLALARLEQQQSLERERMRIARDMHDEMGSKLTKISFLSEHAQVAADADGPMVSQMQAIAQTSRELLQTMDEIVWVVNPRNDSLENLVSYLSHYATEYFQNTPVECDLRLAHDFPNHPLSSEVRHNVFLTFEEALNNVLKHSGASRVQLEMAMRDSSFHIRISDNGSGFDVNEAGAQSPPASARRSGNGLANMRARLADIGGECLVKSRPGQGAEILLAIPLRFPKRKTS